MSRSNDLYHAIDEGRIDQVREILKMDQTLADSSAETPPPIHWAIYRDRLHIVELLLDFGANIERKETDRNSTPLDYAIMYGRVDVVGMLISRGANTDGRLELALRAAKGEFAEYPDLPSMEVYSEVVQCLRARTRGG